jgi:hypothetical protein
VCWELWELDFLMTCCRGSLKQEFVFEGISEVPVPSILRGFSAPVLTLFENVHEPFEDHLDRDTIQFLQK